MKTIFKFPQMLGAVLLLSCTTDVQPDQQSSVTPAVGVVEPPVTPNNNFTDILPPLYPFGNQTSFIKGQVSATANTANVSSFMTTRMAAPDMGTILKSGEKINMVAMGGGMTAGVRNGGLYRYGQMTAYPNLVARQMGMTDFQSPLFAENEANGTGYLQLVDDGTQYPSWKEVSNSKASVKAGNPPELAKYTGSAVHNYALPDGGLREIGTPVNNLGVNVYTNSWSTGRVFSNRLLPKWSGASEISLLNQVLKQPTNFFIVEDDVDFLLLMIKNNTQALSSYGYERYSSGPTMVSHILNLMKENSNANKGVLFTWPIITDLAYFNWYSIQDLKNKAKSISISTTRQNESYTLDGSSNNFLLLPSPAVDALFRNLKKGGEVSVTLDDKDILDPQEFHINTFFVRKYNDRIRELAREKGLAVVDLEKIYGQIHDNTYVSMDGFKVDGSPRGNFFSADGIYPTVIGQGVIANEVIKAINITYKSTIPLINLRDYSQSVGKE